ncbi:MAG TPA: DUF6069 family protein [Acidimicrobiales bacterium]|nr:DUF6069 family protein [Acidimicrobiales bacterium]
MITSTLTSTQPSTHPAVQISSQKDRRLLTVGAAAVSAATATNAVLYAAARAAGVNYTLTQGSTTGLIHLHDVVSLSVFTFAVGLAAAAAARPLGRPSLRALQILGAVIAVASISMDVSVHGAATARVSLAAMHLVVGAAYVAALRMVSSPATPLP